MKFSGGAASFVARTRCVAPPESLGGNWILNQPRPNVPRTHKHRSYPNSLADWAKALLRRILLRPLSASADTTGRPARHLRRHTLNYHLWISSTTPETPAPKPLPSAAGGRPWPRQSLRPSGGLEFLRLAWGDTPKTRRRSDNEPPAISTLRGLLMKQPCPPTVVGRKPVTRWTRAEERAASSMVPSFVPA